MSLTDQTRRMSSTDIRRSRVQTLAKPARRTVELRQWRPTDAVSLHGMLAHDETLQRELGRGDVSTVVGCADVITAFLAVSLPSLQNFAISVGGRAVGNVAVSHMEHRHDTGWISYWVAVEARGQGLATRAVASAARWAFADRDLFRLELSHGVSNPASCRVAVRAGFAAEGVERQKLRSNAERIDVETHARLVVDPAPALALIPVR